MIYDEQQVRHLVLADHQQTVCQSTSSYLDHFEVPAEEKSITHGLIILSGGLTFAVNVLLIRSNIVRALRLYVIFFELDMKYHLSLFSRARKKKKQKRKKLVRRIFSYWLTANDVFSRFPIMI